MNSFLDTLQALRPIWVPSLVLSLAACAGLVLITWSSISLLFGDGDTTRFSW